MIKGHCAENTGEAVQEAAYETQDNENIPYDSDFMSACSVL